MMWNKGQKMKVVLHPIPGSIYVRSDIQFEVEDDSDFVVASFINNEALATEIVRRWNEGADA